MSIKALNWAFSTYIENPSAKLTLIALANYASHPRGTPEGQEECWPMQSTLSEITSLNRRTVIRSLKLLVDLGLISTRREPATQGRFEQNIYILHLVPPSATKSHGPCDTESPAPMCQGVTCPSDKSAISTGHSVTCSINPSEPNGKNLPPAETSALFSFDDYHDIALEAAELDRIWEQVRIELEGTLQKQTFLTWFLPIHPLRRNPWEIRTPNQYFVDWWSEPEHVGLMRSALKLAHDSPLRFVAGEVFSLRTESAKK